MCKELCKSDDYEATCPDCGRMVCFDVVNGDDIMRPAFVTSEGDLYCDRCGKSHERAIEVAEEEDCGEMDYDPYE